MSYYNVRCRPEESDDLADLARRVAGSTRPLKARHGYLDAVVNMQFVSRLWPHFGTATKARFMKRAMPLTAGVSNIYFRDALLDHELDRRIIGYIRAASTGPILPLVITPTTINGQLNVGVTYRQTGFSRTDRSRDGSVPGGNRVSGPVAARAAWRRAPAARTARDKRRRLAALWRKRRSAPADTSARSPRSDLSNSARTRGRRLWGRDDTSPRLTDQGYVAKRLSYAGHDCLLLAGGGRDGAPYAVMDLIHWNLESDGPSAWIESLDVCEVPRLRYRWFWDWDSRMDWGALAGPARSAAAPIRSRRVRFSSTANDASTSWPITSSTAC